MAINSPFLDEDVLHVTSVRAFAIAANNGNERQVLLRIRLTAQAHFERLSRYLREARSVSSRRALECFCKFARQANRYALHPCIQQTFIHAYRIWKQKRWHATPIDATLKR